MSTYQHIRFSVRNDAIDQVQHLIEDYAKYVANYAKDHGEEWTWTTYQAKDTPTDFVSVISHESTEADKRHHEEDGTSRFGKNYTNMLRKAKLSDMKRSRRL